MSIKLNDHINDSNFKEKYISMTGGSNISSISDDRVMAKKTISAVTAKGGTDIVLEIGQTYVFQKIYIDAVTDSLFYYNYEQFEFLGEKKIRQKTQDNTDLNFTKSYAFKRMDPSGEVVMMTNNQILDHICM